MKEKYDVDALEHDLKSVQRDLALLPVPGNTLHSRCSGPCVIEKLNDLNYIIVTNRRSYATLICWSLM